MGRFGRRVIAVLIAALVASQCACSLLAIASGTVVAIGDAQVLPGRPFVVIALGDRIDAHRTIRLGNGR